MNLSLRLAKSKLALSLFALPIFMSFVSLTGDDVMAQKNGIDVKLVTQTKKSCEFPDIPINSEGVSGNTPSIWIPPLIPKPTPQEEKASQLFNQGYQQFDKGLYREALQSWKLALTIYRSLQDRESQGHMLNQIGNVYSLFAEYEKAIIYYKEALIISESLNDYCTWEIRLLKNLARTYNILGQYQKAINSYQKSLALQQEQNGSPMLLDQNSLINIGDIYFLIGEYQKAIDSYQQSLIAARRIYKSLISKDDLVALSIVANSLIPLADAYNIIGEYQKAIDLYQQALAIKKQSRDRRDGEGEIRSLTGLGNVYQNLRQYQKASESYWQALEIEKQEGGRIGQGFKGFLLNKLGNTYFDSGEFQKSINSYQQAIEIAREIGDRSGEGGSLNNLGLAFKNLKQPELAILFYKQSVNVIESIRQDIRKLSKDEQKSYLDTVEKTYRNLADLLLKQDRILEAQQVLDLLKVQELSDYLRNVRGNSETAKGVDLQRPEQNIIALGLELADLLKRDPRTPEQEQRLASLTLQERDQNKQFNAFLQSPEVKKLIKELTLQEDRENIKVVEYNSLRKKLAQVKNAALFYPLILDDRLELILITTTSPPIRKTINLKRTDLNKDILDFRKSLGNPTSTTVQADAQKFYDYLIKPFESELKQAKIETIIYAPDGQLRYIPLAALHDGKQWLIENYRVNNITASSLTNFVPRPYKVPKVFAAAATQSQTIKLDEQPNRSISFDPLPATKIEVEAIKTLIPKTEIFIDQNFNEGSTLEMNQYSIVHLATHGYFAVGQADKSFLLYGDGKTASMTDIKDWSLTNVDLVVLSACETAIGGKVGSGIEILGLGYQIQTAGAGAAIASLWKVSDDGTKALMEELYKSLKQKVSSSEALRQAQIAMINSDKKGAGSDLRAGVRIVGTVPTNSDGSFSHPFYWSAFILIGNGL